MQDDQLYQRLFRNERGIRYTFSTSEDLFPTVLSALEISLFPLNAIDEAILRAVGPGTYPLIYTHYYFEFSMPIPCCDVPEYIEKGAREHVTKKTVMVGFLKREESRKLPHIINVLFPTRGRYSRTINNRIVEYVLDFHPGESWMQVDLCHRPLADNRFAA